MKKIAVGDLGEFWYGDYKEPFEQLEGAVPGHPVGVVLYEDDGGKPGNLLCAYCGGTFENLGTHVKPKHGLSTREYKEEVGLLQKSALVSERLRNTRSATQLRMIRSGKYDPTQHRFTKGFKPAPHRTRDGRIKPEFLNKTGRCRSQVVQVARSIRQRTGRISEKELRRHGIYMNTVKRYFGTMNGLRIEAGMPPVAKRHSYSAFELKQSLWALAQSLGRTPTQSDCRRFGLPTQKVFAREFGSVYKGLRSRRLGPESTAVA